MKLSSTLLCLAAISIAIAALLVTRGGERAPSSPERAVEDSAPPEADVETTLSADLAGVEAPLPVTPAEPTSSREVVLPTGPLLAGTVIDRRTKEPVTSFHLLLSWKHGIGERESGALATAVNRQVADPRGRFELALEETGVYRLRVFSRRHLAETLDDLTVDPSEGAAELLIELKPGLEVSGRVVDHDSGRPVEGAVVGTAEGSRLEYLLTGEPERCLHTVTDGEGRFRLSGLDEKSQKIAALHDDYAEAWQQVLPGQLESVEIRLKRGPRIHGLVLDDAGVPKEGVWITLYGEEIPLGRRVVTGPDGMYESPPVRPGTVELHALPPTGVTDDSFGFSAEWETARVLDADVRVDFGVRTDYALWRGTLFGFDEQPLPEASVSIFFMPPSYVDFEWLRGHARNSATDSEGSFEFRKVPLGSYDLRVWHGGGSVLDRDLRVSLPTPGLHEEDIHLAAESEEGSCRIRGVVIDGATGLPIETEGVSYVMTTQSSPTFRSWSSGIGVDGKFLFDGLPAGRAQVSAHARGWVTEFVTVVLREDHPVDDLRLVLPRAGTLRLRLDGFRGTGPREFRFVLCPEDGNWTRPHDDRLPENGNYEITWPLEPGPWWVTVSFEELGSAERSFGIQESQITEVVIRPEDLVAGSTTVTVAGVVRWEDGTPVPEVSLHFWGGDIPGIAEAERVRGGRTNGAGEFSIAGFRSGRWQVRGTVDGTSAIFSDLVIPTGAADPFPLHLVLPGGRLTGTLFDRRTGLPLGDGGPPRWLFLGRASGGPNVCEIQGGQTGSPFQIDGVPEGDYVLAISARGFSRYASEPFHHSGKGLLDLGRIELEPCGNLELEVVDEAGLPVPEFHVYLDGRVLPPYERRSLGEGRFEVSNLPIGAATIEVRADGYQICREELTFGADAPIRHRFILERL